MEVSFNPPFRALVRGVRAAYVMTYGNYLVSALRENHHIDVYLPHHQGSWIGVVVWLRHRQTPGLQ